MEKNIELKLNIDKSNNSANIDIIVDGEKVKNFDSKDNSISALEIFEIIKIEKNASINLKISPEIREYDNFNVIANLFKELTEKINYVSKGT